MEIIRIPSSYELQVSFLSGEDIQYVFTNLFKLCRGEEIKIENSMRGGLLFSIYRETLQLENKARAKKGEKELKIDNATLSHHTSHPDESKSCDQVKSSQVKSNQINISKDIDTNVSETKEISLINKEKIKKEVYGNEEINDIIKAIKEKHGIVDGTIQEQRNYGNLLVRKIKTIDGFNGDFYNFIKTVIEQSDSYRIGKTTSPKKIYYNLSELIANIRINIEKSKPKKVINIPAVDLFK